MGRVMVNLVALTAFFSAFDSKVGRYLFLKYVCVHMQVEIETYKKQKQYQQVVLVLCKL